MLKTRLLIILQLAATLIFESPAAFRHDIQNLTSRNVSKIQQDKVGFIWIGTDNGLNRYDGWKNVTFTLDRKDSTSLKSNNVEYLMTDDSGTLWVASGAGLQKYIPESGKFSNVEFPDGIHPSVRSVIQTAPDRLMAVTSGYGVFSIDITTMKASNQEDIDRTMGSKYAHIIKQDGLNRIWIGGADGIITAIDKNQRKLYADRLPGRIADIEHDRNNNVWAVTQTELYRWDGSKGRFTTSTSTPDGQIRGLTRTNDGELLLFTLEDGVFRINPDSNSLEELETYRDIRKEGITEMYEDRAGIMWCATVQKGISINTESESFFKYLPIATTPSRKIECLYEDAGNGGISVAMSDGTVLRFSSDLIQTGIRTAPGRITAAYTTPEGALLTGYGDGRLMLLDKGKSTLIGHFTAGPVHAIARDAGGRYYIGLTGDGMRISQDLKNWKTINESTEMATAQRLGNNWINHITPTSTGMIWIGHSNGIDVFDPEKNTFIDSEAISRLRAHVVYAMQEGNDGSMWIGTNYGLYHLPPKGDSIELLAATEGMGGNVICGIAEANNGDIWCTTNSGISRIRHTDRKIINYHKGSGLAVGEFLKGILLRGSDEKVYAAGIDGIISFHPDAIRDERTIWAPMPTGIHITSSRDNDPRVEYTPGAKNGISARVRLRHYQNTFTLDFSNFDYRNAENIEFEYRIPKLKDYWQKNPPGDNRVVCNYMEPGKYTLEVRAIENGQPSPSTSILIEVLPPWYLTIWAKAAYILLTTLAAAGVWYAQSRYRLQRHKEELSEEKFKLLYNFAHELRSPLTLITSPLTGLIREETDPRKAETFRMMQRNGYRISNLVNQMLDIRRIEKGQLKLAFSETDLESYLRQITEDFRMQAESCGITLTFSAPDGPVTAYIDTDNFDKIIVNLISNALKHTPTGGQIEIELRKAQTADGKEKALIEVTDTGGGIKPEDLDRIFERFYQSGRKNKGFGIGLNLTKMLVDMHHGAIRATNREDIKGARFEVIIPLGRKHLKDNEINNHISGPTEDIHLVAKESVSVPAELPTKPGYKYHRVLIADDDDEIRQYLKRELGQTYKIVMASDGGEAYMIAQDKEIDLIVSDINMPDTDGFSLLRQLRSNADLAHIPVILLTTSEDFETRMAGWEKGADAYLTKPFHIEELQQLCSSLISSRIRLKGRFSHGENAEEKIDKVEIKGNDDLLLERITKAVNENLGNSEFGVEELAEAVGLSRVHLHRKMKALIGLAPRDFLKSVRLKRAAELLKKNNTNISQVGYMVGFSSPGQFSDSFKKYFGCSPSEYIAKKRDDKPSIEEKKGQAKI